MIFKTVLRFSLLGLYLSSSVEASDGTLLADYRGLATNLVQKTKSSSSPQDILELQGETRKLIELGTQLLKLYGEKNPSCTSQYLKLIEEIPSMESQSLSFLHERYHNGKGLPWAPRFCYFGRSQVIHPVMNLVRMKGAFTDEVRAQVVEEFEEVVHHLLRIEQNLNNPPVDSQFEKGKNAIHSMSGCYLVDYNFVETESLRPDYSTDKRVYDVNKNKSVKEWIYAEEISATQIRLQHILFSADLTGKVSSESLLKHQAEDWDYNAQYLLDFTAPNTWQVKPLNSGEGQWTRRITNLDDGPRYQCAAVWNEKTAYPEWTCANFAPIPGRETRDMGRKDYNTLDRTTRIIAYGTNWLERQENTKIVFKEGERQAFAKEVGKTWYIRIPDSECIAAQEFVHPRRAFWTLLRETWAGVFEMRAASGGLFMERVPSGQPPRFAKMMEIEALNRTSNLDDPEIRERVRDNILEVISEYQAN